MSTINLQEILNLPVERRLEIMDAIWESIDREVEHLPLTVAQKQELDRRLAAYEANPRDVVSWKEVSKSLDELD